MILTCPACTMRYLVSEGAIGPNGRRVRCAHCGNQWVQEPEEGLDEALFGTDDDEGGIDFDTASPILQDDDDAPFEVASREVKPAADEAAYDFQSILQKELEGAPIPEGVKPIPRSDDEVLPARGKGGKLSSGRLGGFAAAATVWVLLLGMILLMQPQISRAWPPSNLFYSFFGMKPVPPGEGLGLSGLRAELAEGKIRLLGDIINLRETELKVPSVMASIVDANGKEIDRILIAPPVARLKAEGQVSFDALYPKIPDGAANVNYAFSFVKVKPAETAVEDAHEEAGVPPTEIKVDDHAEEHKDGPANDHH